MGGQRWGRQRETKGKHLKIAILFRYNRKEEDLYMQYGFPSYCISQKVMLSLAHLSIRRTQYKEGLKSPLPASRHIRSLGTDQ